MRSCTHTKKDVFSEPIIRKATFHGFFQAGDLESGAWTVAIIEYEDGQVAKVEAHEIKFD